MENKTINSERPNRGNVQLTKEILDRLNSRNRKRKKNGKQNGKQNENESEKESCCLNSSEEVNFSDFSTTIASFDDMNHKFLDDMDNMKIAETSQEEK